MEAHDRKDATAAGLLWQAFGGAVTGLARQAGCTASACPLPEVREAARELSDWPSRPVSHESRDRVAA